MGEDVQAHFVAVEAIKEVLRILSWRRGQRGVIERDHAVVVGRTEPTDGRLREPERSVDRSHEAMDDEQAATVTAETGQVRRLDGVRRVVAGGPCAQPGRVAALLVRADCGVRRRAGGLLQPLERDHPQLASQETCDASATSRRAQRCRDHDVVGVAFGEIPAVLTVLFDEDDALLVVVTSSQLDDQFARLDDTAAASARLLQLVDRCFGDQLEADGSFLGGVVSRQCRRHVDEARGVARGGAAAPLESCPQVFTADLDAVRPPFLPSLPSGAVVWRATHGRPRRSRVIVGRGLVTEVQLDWQLIGLRRLEADRVGPRDDDLGVVGEPDRHVGVMGTDLLQGVDIRVLELGSVGADEDHGGVDQVEQSIGDVLPTAMVRELEQIDGELGFPPLNECLLDCRLKVTRVCVAGEQEFDVVDFEEEGDARSVRDTAVLAEHPGGASIRPVDVRGIVEGVEKVRDRVATRRLRPLLQQLLQPVARR